MRRFAFVFLALVVWSRPAAGQTTALFIDSSPGESIGHGARQTITTVDANFSASRISDQEISLRVIGPSSSFFWNLGFKAPGTTQPAVGTYDAARRTISSAFNGLDIGGSGGGCNQLTGRFVVREAVYGSSGSVVRFAADFEQHCEDLDPGLFGAIRYNSTISDLVPFGGDYPRFRLRLTTPLHGRVAGGGLDCGGPGATCSVSLSSPATLALTATADAGYIFGGWTDDCSGDARTSVHVNSPRTCSAIFLPVVASSPRNLALLNSSPGDYIGQGRNEVFSTNGTWTLSPVTTTAFVINITAVAAKGDNSWYFTLAPPTGQTAFQTGRQYSTSRFGDTTAARLDISANHAGCNSSVGTLTVREWVAGTGAVPARFAIDFQYQCDSGGLLVGTLQYASLFAFPTADVDRSSLRFAATMDAQGIASHTPDQSVTIRVSDATISWQLKSDQAWLTASPASGVGGGVITISVRSGVGLVERGTVTGHIYILTAGTASPGPVTITLDLYPSGKTAPPVGAFDTPIDGASGVAGSIAVTGWALDDIGVDRVEIWRDRQPGETTPPFSGGDADPRNGKVFIGNAMFVDGARPDVEQLYSSWPAASRGGWGYLLLTQGLWNGGNGPFTVYAYAFDIEGKAAVLAAKNFVADNAHATKPFGSIDTPGIGARVSGTVVNFGWGLTPRVNGVATCRIPANAVQVSIDSAPLQPVVYGDARSDIAGAFAGLSNSNAAGGHFTLDTTSLSNGVHTIGWLIADDCGRADGVGSRFFNVSNGASALTAPEFRLNAEASSSADFRLKAETGPDAPFRLKAETTHPDSVVSGFSRNGATDVLLARGYGELPDMLAASESGVYTVEVKQGERIESRLPRGYDDAYQLVGDKQRTLPVGSTWDASNGIFYWQPAAAFLGSYEVVFRRDVEQIRVRVFIGQR